MKFDEFISTLKNRNKDIEFYNRIKDEFINEGLEKYLFYTFREEQTYMEKAHKYINNQMTKPIREEIITVLAPLRKAIFEAEKRNHISFIFSYSPRKMYYLAMEYAHKHAKQIDILPNLFEDDNTINYLVTFEIKNRKEAYYFARFIVPKINQVDLAGYRVYGVGIDVITNLCEYNSEPIVFKKPNLLTHFWGNMFRCDNNPYKIRQIRKVINEMMDRGFFLTEIEMACVLREHIMIPMQNIYINNKKYYNNHDITTYHKEYKFVRDQLFNEMIKERKIPVKWKSERALFELVLSMYDDAIFQYRPSWLSPQSLDIYVPSIKTAIEYQGIQHYKEIDFFGGTEGLKKRIELDNKKRKLCEDNLINLIEWHYEDTLSKIILKRKIESIRVKFK